MSQPLDFTIAVKDFDLYLLPENSRDVRSEAFQNAVADFYARQFAPLGGTASVAFEGDTIHVTWVPSTTSQHPFQYALSLLKAGNYVEAFPILDLLLVADPTDTEVLKNYGMAQTEAGHPERAINLLKRAVELAPANADIYTALGFAYQRNGDSDEAIRAMQKAVEVDPENGYAQRNLGGMLGNEKRHAEAEPYLRAAARLMPKDQGALYGLARWLEQDGGDENEAEADHLYKQVIALDGDSEIGELAKKAQRRIAQKSFRGNASGTFRMDAVMYILGALERFAKLDQAQIQRITFEIGMLGQRGLDVNNPDSQYRLKSIEGAFSGLHLMAIMYTGFKQIRPEADIGFDLSNEYVLAMEMFESKAGTT